MSANMLAGGRLIGNSGAVIILSLVISPVSFLAAFVCRFKYHELNG
jgi:hypothetical protein